MYTYLHCISWGNGWCILIIHFYYTNFYYTFLLHIFIIQSHYTIHTFYNSNSEVLQKLLFSPQKGQSKSFLLYPTKMFMQKVICFNIFIFQGVLAYFAFALGNPWRLMNGYDSFGNTCGMKNTKPDGFTSPYAGKDLTDFP